MSLFYLKISQISYLPIYLPSTLNNSSFHNTTWFSFLVILQKKANNPHAIFKRAY